MRDGSGRTWCSTGTARTSSSSITIGSTQLAVLKRIDRCVVVTRAQPDLGRDLEVLRTINRERSTCLGVGATVTRPGQMRVGDELSVSGG
jgi:uncharacterized protein YcbX